MAWRYPVSYVVDGDHVVPYELDREFEVLASEINGMLDRDNFGEQLGSSKFASGAFNALHQEHFTGSVAFSGTIVEQWTPIFGMDLVSLDCALAISGHLRWAKTAGAGTFGTNAWVGLFVDDILVGKVASNDLATNINQSVTLPAVHVPVANGAHRVELRFIINDPRVGTTYTVTRGHIRVREVRR